MKKDREIDRERESEREKEAVFQFSKHHLLFVFVLKIRRLKLFDGN